MTMTVHTRKGTPVTEPLPRLIGAYFNLYDDDSPVAAQLAEALEAAVTGDVCNQPGCGKPLAKAAVHLHRVKGRHRCGIAAVCEEHNGKFGRAFTVTIEGAERRVVLQSKVFLVLSAEVVGEPTVTVIAGSGT